MTSLIYCEHAKGLLEGLRGAISDLIKLHEEQFNSLIGGDLDSTRFDPLIHVANERKHEAKYAYLHHLEAHRCSKFDATTD